MKKFSKIMIMILMVAITAGSFFISPLMSVFAAVISTAAITLTKVPTSGTINEEIKLPLASQSDVKILVINPNGKVIYKTGEVENNAEVELKSSYLSLNPKMLGDYKVKYIAGDVESEVYTISVTGVKPTITFADNSKEIVPSSLGYKNAENVVNTITLPTPTITEGEDEVTVGSVASSVVESKGYLNDLNNKTLTSDKVAELVGYYVNVIDSSYNEVETGFVANLVGDKYYINYTVSPKENVYGRYTVTYTYQSNLRAVKKLVFEVKKNFEEKQDITFTWQDGKTMPTTAVLGNEVELPKPQATYKNGTTAKVYTDVKVYHVEKNAMNNLKNDNYDQADAGNVTGWTPVKVEDFKFVAGYKATDGASYVIRYVLTDFFGNKVTKQYTLTNVYDSEAPKVYMVADYSADGASADTETSVEDMLPKYVQTGKSVTLPAIYATDNSQNALISDEDKEISLTRRYVLDGVTYNFTSESSKITSKSDTKEFTNKEEVVFTPTQSGTYTFYYEGRDKAGNTSSSTKFVIKVEDDYNDTIAPELTIPTIATTAYAGETINFDAPTAIDYKDADKTEIINNNVKVDVKYYINDETTNLTAVSTNKDGSYSLNIPNSGADKVTVVFTAKDHARYSENNADNKTFKKVVINVKNVSADLTAPTINGTIQDLFETKQDSEKQIQEIKFEDENDINVAIKVTSKDEDGNISNYAVSGKNVVKNGNVYTVSDATFTSYHVGEHLVTFIATDANGNTAIVAYKVNVTRSITPTLEVTNKIDSTIEVGKTLVLPQALLKDYDGETVDADISVEMVGINPEYELIGNRFTAKEHNGVYTFRYKAIYNQNGETKTIYSSLKTITATDTNKPEITIEDDAWQTWDSSESMPVALEYKEATDGAFVKVDGSYVKYDSSNSAHAGLTRYAYKEIELPSFSASDRKITNGDVVADNKIDEYSIKVTDAEGKVLLESINGANLLTTNSANGYDAYYAFTPNGNGKYTVVYSATDIAGNTTTKTIILQVGDNIAPEITLNDAQDVKASPKVGDKLVIKLDQIELEDNVDTDIDIYKAVKATEGVKFSIKIETPTGDKVTLSTTNTTYYNSTDKTFTYTLSEAGDYKVTYELTDTAGLTHTIVKTITVASKNSTNVISEQAIGTILIVASVALLAGVVTYFVVTNKKYVSKKKDNK